MKNGRHLPFWRGFAADKIAGLLPAARAARSFIPINFAVDLIYALLDPRLRRGRA